MLTEATRRSWKHICCACAENSGHSPSASTNKSTIRFIDLSVTMCGVHTSCGGPHQSLNALVSRDSCDLSRASRYRFQPRDDRCFECLQLRILAAIGFEIQRGEERQQIMPAQQPPAVVVILRIPEPAR